LTIKARCQMPLHVTLEITHYEEIRNKIFNIDVDIDIYMNVWDNARNAIEPISFHSLHG
jgi:hypothetical protein